MLADIGRRNRSQRRVTFGIAIHGPRGQEVGTKIAGLGSTLARSEIKRRGAGHNSRKLNVVEVEAAAAITDVSTHHLRAGFETDIAVDGLPHLAAAGVRHEHLARLVHPVKLKTHLAPGAITGNAGLKLVKAGGRNLDAVFEPFVSTYPTDIEASAAVSSRFNVDTGAAVGSAVVGRIYVVISNAIVTLVEVFCLHGAWHWQRLIEKRQLVAWRSRRRNRRRSRRRSQILIRFEFDQITVVQGVRDQDLNLAGGDWRKREFPPYPVVASNLPVWN